MIKKLSFGQEKEIYTLIKTVFDEFIGYDYSEKGNNMFYDYIKPEKISSRVKEGNILLLYEKANKIIGMIEIRNNNHICLFFVAKEHHNSGIGKILLKSVIEKISDKTDFLEVNASPFSEKIYSKLGFIKTGEQTETDGILYIPMKLVLNS